MNVLLVEDDLIIRMDLENRIRHCGAVVAAATATGEGAVELAREHEPDLILMDIKLKGEMDGIEAAVRISEFLVCTIIFISSYEKQDVGDRLVRSRCTIGYFSKPLSNETLRRIVAIPGTNA